MKLRRCPLLWFGTTVLLLLGTTLCGSNASLVPPPPLPLRQRVVAIGDLHGDLHNTLLVLRIAQVIAYTQPVEEDAASEQAHRYPPVEWVGGDTIVIQLGDVMDRGPDTFAILDLFHDLTMAARNAGGDIIMLYGNHEVMNLSAQFSYVHPREEFGGTDTVQRLRLLERDGSRFATYLRQERKTVHVLHRMVFVHAGISPAWATLGVDGINQRVQDAIDKQAWSDPIVGMTGPLWTRAIINDAVNGKCDAVRDALLELDATHMIVGHTPEQTGEIGEYCDGALYVIDTLISRWMRPEQTAATVDRYVRALQISIRRKGAETEATAIPILDPHLPDEYVGRDPNTNVELMDLGEWIAQEQHHVEVEEEEDDVILEELGIPSELVEAHGDDAKTGMGDDGAFAGGSLEDALRRNHILQEINERVAELNLAQGQPFYDGREHTEL